MENNVGNYRRIYGTCNSGVPIKKIPPLENPPTPLTSQHYANYSAPGKFSSNYSIKQTPTKERSFRQSLDARRRKAGLLESALLKFKAKRGVILSLTERINNSEKIKKLVLLDNIRYEQSLQQAATLIQLWWKKLRSRNINMKLEKAERSLRKARLKISLLKKEKTKIMRSKIKYFPLSKY